MIYIAPSSESRRRRGRFVPETRCSNSELSTAQTCASFSTSHTGRSKSLAVYGGGNLAVVQQVVWRLTIQTSDYPSKS